MSFTLLVGKKAKRLGALLGCALLLLMTIQPYAALAQEADPTLTPTPTETTDITVENGNTTADTTADVEANTGDNTVGDEPTPTPAPEDSDEIISPVPEESQADPEPTPTNDPNEESTQSGSIDNSATVESTVSATANTGNNTIQNIGDDHHDESSNNTENNQEQQDPTPTPTPTPSGTSEIETGDSYAYAQVENAVNTTTVNSQIIYHTINLYMNEAGTIDLSMPSELAKLLVEQNPDVGTINAALKTLAVENEADVDTNVSVSAETGENTATESAKATISTGDAFAILSLLNRINLVMVDSVLHIAIINIFGDFYGNIWLPDVPDIPACDECGAFTVENDATVQTTVTVTSNTGNNTVVAGNGDIDTGDAYTGVNVVDLVNTVVYGTPYLSLYINNYGIWEGGFLGWATDGLPTSTEMVVPSTICSTCIGDIDITNNAFLTNNVSVSALTGGNTINASKYGDIETGNAYAAANIVNIVNTSLIRSFGIIGFINNFGYWKGFVGSKSLFPIEESDTDNTNKNEQQPSTTTTAHSGGSVREDGGLLSVTTSNNVGEYVLPGDTVTLFATVKNPGEGKVYDTKLIIMLIKDDTEAGSTVFDLGDIQAGKSIKFSTGLVLSKNAPAGFYKVRAAAYGYTGEDNTKVSAYADSYFSVFGTIAFTPPASTAAAIAATPEVMGAVYTPKQEPNILKALLVLLLLFPVYWSMRVWEGRHYLGIVFKRQLALSARIRAIRILLL